MNRRFVIGVTLVGLLILTVEFLAVAWLAAPTRVGAANAAAAIAIITAAAVGIERVIEGFWTAVGLLKDSWWPFGQFGKQLETLVNQLDDVLSQYFDRAAAKAQELKQGGKEDEGEELQHIKLEIARVQARTKALRQDLGLLVPDKQHVQLLAASAVDAVSYVERLLPEAQREAAIAMQAITGVTDFVETFKENPGRRLISIFAGAGIGLLIAWSLGLDVFQAALVADVAATGGGALFPALGVAITGVLIGLGANPTHEVIRLVQEYKKSPKAANSPTPIPADERVPNVFRPQPVVSAGGIEPIEKSGARVEVPAQGRSMRPTRFTTD